MARRFFPPDPFDASSEEISLTVGKLRHPTEAVESVAQSWLSIPARGLLTGACIVGAVDSGKTSAYMHPFTKQPPVATHPDRQVLYDRLTGGSRSADCAQRFSRIGERVHLPGATAADADALLAAWGIENGESLKAARSIARRPGGLPDLDHALKFASVHSPGPSGQGGAHPLRVEGPEGAT